MSGKHTLIGFLACLSAIVIIVALGVAAVAFDLRNPNAFELFAAAVTGLVAVAMVFRPGKSDQE